MLTSDGEPVKDNIRWDIYAAQTNVEGKRKRITGTYDAQPQRVLDPGKYIVVAQYGSAVARQEFEVKARTEAGKHVLVLDAGLLALKAVYADGGEAINSGMRWDIYGLEKTLDGKRKHFTGTYDTTPLFRLPKGRYRLVARRGAALEIKEVEVAANRRNEIVVDMKAGLLAPHAVLTKGSKPLKNVRYDVYGLEKDLEGHRKHFDGTYDAAPVFTLTAGAYELVTKAGSAVGRQKVEIAAGKRKDLDVDLNAGQIKLVAKARDGSQIANGIRWDIFSGEKNLEGKRNRITGTSTASPVMTLSAATYHVVVRAGGARYEGALKVEAGDSKMVEVTLQ